MQNHGAAMMAKRRGRLPDPEGPKKSVAISGKLVRMARTLADYHGKDLGAYLGDLLEGPITSAWAAMLRETDPIKKG
jgi:hypothetical protein